MLYATFWEYVLILYIKFKLSKEKTAFVPRDSVIFYGISLKFMISQSTVGYYSIPRSRVTRGQHALSIAMENGGRARLGWTNK